MTLLLVLSLGACSNCPSEGDDGATALDTSSPGDSASEADTGDSGAASGPDLALGEADPGGSGLAGCAWVLYETARDEFSGDARLVVLSGVGDLAGNADSCLGVFSSRSRAGRVATAYYDGREPIIEEEDTPDLPYCTSGSVSYDVLVSDPVSDWRIDSDVLAAAFADVASSTFVSLFVIQPQLLPELNLCAGGNLHLAEPEGEIGSVFAAVARDCGANGAYCAVAIDAATGSIIERQ